MTFLRALLARYADRDLAVQLNRARLSVTRAQAGRKRAELELEQCRRDLAEVTLDRDALVAAILHPSFGGE